MEANPGSGLLTPSPSRMISSPQSRVVLPQKPQTANPGKRPQEDKKGNLGSKLFCPSKLANETTKLKNWLARPGQLLKKKKERWGRPGHGISPSSSQLNRRWLRRRISARIASGVFGCGGRIGSGTVARLIADGIRHRHRELEAERENNDTAQSHGGQYPGYSTSFSRRLEAPLAYR